MLRRILLFAAMMFLFCTQKPQGPDTAGTGSRAGNALISGVLLNVDGTAAANAEVDFIPVSQDPTVGTGNLIVITAYTDGKGVYGLNTALKGTYNIFGNDKAGNLSFHDSLPLTGDTFVVATDTVKPSGGIKCVFKAQDDTRLIDVIFWGTSLGLVPVAKSGLMEISGLAAGDYPVRIKLSADYEVIDTVIKVLSGQVTDLDTITLPYLKVPMVTGLKAAYDTLRNQALLTWNKLDTAIISGYNIYRNKVGTNIGSPLNSVLITDTLFRDSVLTDSGVYLYHIKAVNKNGDEGTVFSIADTVFTAGKSLVETRIQFAPPETAGINDDVRISVIYSNPSRKNIAIKWYIGSDALVPIRVKADSTKSGSDSIVQKWTTEGTKAVRIEVTDEAGVIWKNSLNQVIILDPPTANAGNDVAVKAGNNLNLSGTIFDRFDSLNGWWEVGGVKLGLQAGPPNRNLNIADTFQLPDTACSIDFVLKVVDADSLRAEDTLKVVVYTDSQFLWFTTKPYITDNFGHSVMINFGTNLLSFATILYDTVPLCKNLDTDLEIDSIHHIALFPLLQGTRYFYRAVISGSSRSDTSELSAFTTQFLEGPGRFNILKLPAGDAPTIDGIMNEWPEEYLVATISGEENVFVKPAPATFDPHVGWNGKLYAAFDDNQVYFAVKVTTDDFYRIGHDYSSDNIKVNLGGQGRSFYIYSDGTILRNPSCPFAPGTTLSAACISFGSDSLPSCEFSINKQTLLGMPIDTFKLNIGTEDADAGSDQYVIGFGARYGLEKNTYIGQYDNTAYYPTYTLRPEQGPSLK